MTEQLELFELDTLKLDSQLPTEFPVRDVVPGRVVHIDADFIAYITTTTPDATIEQMREGCDFLINRMKRAAGAEHVALHLTASGSTKGNRYNIALLKQYQANRVGKETPEFLNAIKEFMVTQRGAIAHSEMEADDSICIAQYDAIRAGNKDLSVIATRDKDLTMIPGLHVNWDTGEISDITTDFGYIELDRSKKAAKIKGRGFSYFWAQMLTGDSADNISGLPKMIVDGKPKPVGPVAAYALLEGAKTNIDAYRIVATAYKRYGEAVGFKNYRDGSDVTWQQAFYSEAKLLWMRRSPSENDVIDWLREAAS